jgi:hypothetical protein
MKGQEEPGDPISDLERREILKIILWEILLSDWSGATTRPLGACDCVVRSLEAGYLPEKLARSNTFDQLGASTDGWGFRKIWKFLATSVFF